MRYEIIVKEKQHIVFDNVLKSRMEIIDVLGYAVNKMNEEAAQGIAKSSVQQTEGRLFPAEQNKNSGLPEFDQNPPHGGLRPS